MHEQEVNGLNGKDRTSTPDPEVQPKSRRRRFTAKYKLRILEEVDRCSQPGEIGSIIRREGLYSSHLTKWRRQREQGVLEALGKKRGRKEDPDTALRKDIQRLERQNEKLKRELAKAHVIIGVQKKLCDLLGLTDPDEKT